MVSHANVNGKSVKLGATLQGLPLLARKYLHNRYFARQNAASCRTYVVNCCFANEQTSCPINGICLVGPVIRRTVYISVFVPINNISTMLFIKLLYRMLCLFLHVSDTSFPASFNIQGHSGCSLANIYITTWICMYVLLLSN